MGNIKISTSETKLILFTEEPDSEINGAESYLKFCSSAREHLS
jgi:hypothetical protein